MFIPNPAILTDPTFHIGLNCPPDEIKLRIFNIAAELPHQTIIPKDAYIFKNNKYIYTYKLNASNLASGVYIYIIQCRKNNSFIKRIDKLAVIR